MRLFVTFVSLLSLLLVSPTRSLVYSPSPDRPAEEETKESKESAKKPIEEALFREHRVRVPEPHHGTTRVELVTEYVSHPTKAIVPDPPHLPRRLL